MIRGTANARFESRYRVTLTIASVIAATIHLAGALGAPPYAPSPFQLRAPIIRAIEVPVYQPISPPKSIPRPNIEIADGPVDPPEVPLPPNFGDGVLDAPLPPREDPGTFVPYDEPPKLVRQVAPEYPDLARRAEATGRVVLIVTVDATGRVTDVVVRESTVIPTLERAAIHAVRQWLFTPAKQRDKPVPCRIAVPFSFSMRGR